VLLAEPVASRPRASGQRQRPRVGDRRLVARPQRRALWVPVSEPGAVSARPFTPLAGQARASSDCDHRGNRRIITARAP
jgi:hypothetical protein